MSNSHLHAQRCHSYTIYHIFLTLSTRNCVFIKCRSLNPCVLDCARASLPTSNLHIHALFPMSTLEEDLWYLDASYVPSTSSEILTAARTPNYRLYIFLLLSLSVALATIAYYFTHLRNQPPRKILSTLQSPPQSSYQKLASRLSSELESTGLSRRESLHLVNSHLLSTRSDLFPVTYMDVDYWRLCWLNIAWTIFVFTVNNNTCLTTSSTFLSPLYIFLPISSSSICYAYIGITFLITSVILYILHKIISLFWLPNFLHSAVNLGEFIVSERFDFAGNAVIAQLRSLCKVALVDQSRFDHDSNHDSTPIVNRNAILTR